MIFPGPNGPSLVSQEFNQMCTEMRVEARISSGPNPGDPYRSVRLIHFRNYNNEVIKITQFNKRGTVLNIPANGEADIMLLPDEPLPIVEKMSG